MTIRVCALLAVVCWTSTASASILFFDAGVSNGSPLPESYGDNVSALSVGSFNYGVGSEGFTPDVTASYGGELHWGGGWGAVNHAIYSVSNNIDMSLTAAPGYQVSLNSFDVAGWNNTPISTFGVSVSVLDGFGGVLYSELATVGSSGHFDFSSPLTSQSITILVSNAPGYGGYVGLSNVTFGEVAHAPEPGSLALLGLGVSGFGFYRCRKGARRRSVTKLSVNS